MKTNTPTLRFPEFTDEWQENKLGDIADVKGGKRIPIGYSLLSEDNGLPYITVSGMENGGIDFDEVKFVPKEVAKQIQDYKISVKDIYVSVAGTLGLIGVIPPELDGANLTENANKLTNIKTNRDYLLQYLKSSRFNKLVKNVKTDNAQPKLAIYAIKCFKVSVPSKQEQQKIANFLTVVDEKINKLEEKKKGFEKYKKGVIQAIFSQKIRFNKPNGSDYPNWEEKKLGELLDYEQPTKYIVRSTEYSNDHKIPVLTAGKSFILGYTNETDGLYNDFPVIIFDDFTTTSQFVNFPFKVKSSAMKILKAKSDADIKFIFEAIQQIKYEIGGHGRHWISKYSNIKILVPSLQEQEKIAGFLTSLDNKVDLINKKLEQAKVFKKGLLQQMFV